MADPAPTTAQNTEQFNNASGAAGDDWTAKSNELADTVKRMKQTAPNLAKDIDEAYKPAYADTKELDAKKIAKSSVTAIDNLKKLTETHKELDAFKSPLAALGQDFSGFANAKPSSGYAGLTESQLGGGMMGGMGGGIMGFLVSIMQFFREAMGKFKDMFPELAATQTNDPKLGEGFKQKNQETLEREARAAEAAKNGAEPEKKPETSTTEQTAATPEATTTTTTTPKQAAPAPQ